MADGRQNGPFGASFTYTEDILSDFEALYLQKKEIPAATRVVLALLGVAGAVYFGWGLYREGLALTRVGYLLICSVMLVVALSGGRNRPDDSLKKYRKYYLNRGASFTIDEDGVQMHLEGQKNYAKSRFKEIYCLNDTDACLYFVIKGKAYYILPKAAVSGGSCEELMRYMQRKCQKRFQHYDFGE